VLCLLLVSLREELVITGRQLACRDDTCERRSRTATSRR
jgi:hypothetical protein